MLKLKIIAIFLLYQTLAHANADIKTETLEYNYKTTKMEGFIAYNPTLSSTRPGILIVHDWMGLGEYTKNKAIDLARQGYVAFAVDIYGKGVRPKNSDEAAKLATKFKSDRNLLRNHIKAAYDKLVSMTNVNGQKIIAMGYCFGGTTALELARSGASLIGTASFHGGLSTPTLQDAKNIKGQVLVMHGADDPYVPALEVDTFKKEMADAKVKYKFISYPDAVHSFTIPDAGTDKSKGAAYNASADKKSWSDFQNFLKTVM